MYMTTVHNTFTYIKV